MTYFYDDYVEHYGKIDKFSGYGTYIMLNGTLFDVDTYASIAHAGGFVIPFFRSYMISDKDKINYYSKEELLSYLISWKEAMLTKKYDVNPKEQQMRFHLVQYFYKYL